LDFDNIASNLKYYELSFFLENIKLALKGDK